MENFEGFDEEDLIQVNAETESSDTQEKEVWEPSLEFSQAEIIESIKVCLAGISPLIKPTTTLKNMVFHILKAFFIDKKKYVISNCPTGSGKTIIGFMTYFCTQYLIQLKFNGKSEARPDPENALCYFLTSNKVLQEQIDRDIERFKFHDYLFMLKGVANYKCLPADAEFKSGNKKIRDKVLFKNPDATFASYDFRPCIGMTTEKILESFDCFEVCPYKTARSEASHKSCTILNYAYFLNVLRTVDDGNPNKFFIRRTLTIADEAHLIPEIINSFFNYEFTQSTVHRVRKLVDDIIGEFGSKVCLHNNQELITPCLRFFLQPVNRLSEILIYIENLKKVDKMLVEIRSNYNGDSFNSMFSERISNVREQIASFTAGYQSLKKLFNERPEDVYFESEKSVENKELGINVFKHVVKDLKEAEMVRNNFLDRCHYGLFMSATLGDMDEYASLMGMNDDEYTTLFLPSTFDFTKSPIYLCESGWLNYNNFDKNIDKVLLDAIRICNNHSNEKGVIHTGTFKIQDLLKHKIIGLGNTIDINRFLFYTNTKEKEMLIDQFKNSTIPYIMVGPSLYEGIDLPDDKCRFQILVKVPYAQMTGYIKKKIERYPFWYKRNCIEKIIQAIGRSNRHANDYSKIYLLDSCFDKIIYETNKEICERLEYKKIY